MFSDCFPDRPIKDTDEIPFEDEDNVEQKERIEKESDEAEMEKDSDDEKDLYEIMDDIGLLGNVEQDTKQINKCKEIESKNEKQLQKFPKEKTPEDKGQLALLSTALKEMKHAAMLNLAAIQKIV